MPTIGMCDRCYALGLTQAIGTLIFHPSPNGKTTKLELCPECVSEMVHWISADVNRAGGPTFRKSYDEMQREEAERVKELEKGGNERHTQMDH